MRKRDGRGLSIGLGVLAVAACANVVPASAAQDSVCPGLVVQTPEDLASLHDCAVIDGDLKISSKNIERIGPEDLPKLREVRGSLIAVADAALRELTLPALREVGTQADDILEIGFASDGAERIALPALEVVHGSFGIAALGNLRELDLRSLELVTQNFALVTLPALRKLRIPSELYVGDRVAFQQLCQLPSSQLPDIDVCDPEKRTLSGVGCCTEDAIECSDSLCGCP